MKSLFDKISVKCSRIITKSYSTSFSFGIHFLTRTLRDPIYSIYGFVRLADEIVDSFHNFNKTALLDKFEKDTFQAIEAGISLNPVLNSFQEVVRTYNINCECVKTFLESMRMDLKPPKFTPEVYDNYILGSAEVVGLMCLRVFVRGDTNQYERLKPYAMKLGSAFQKVNFLRDVGSDYLELGRSYFPGVNLDAFDDIAKKEIEADIDADFKMGYQGINMLPRDVRFGVFVAYVYYCQLFRKIKNNHATKIFQRRVRVSNKRKFALIFSSYFKHSFNLI